MKIQMRTTASGPDGIFLADKQYSVSDNQGDISAQRAKDFCIGGYAFVVDESKVEEKGKKSAPVESAAVSAPESASLAHVPTKPAGRRR